MRTRLQEILLREPILISLTVRWLGWLVALGIVVFDAAPAQNLEQGAMVLTWTFLLLVFLTLYPLGLRKRWFRPHWTHDKPYIPLLDILAGLLAVYQTGGWDSPFYHFAVTAVLAPSLRYGVIGAVASATTFLVFYYPVVYYTEAGYSVAMLANGNPSRGLVSTPFNPFMIGLFAAFLGEVLERLRAEQEKVRKLAAGEERARMAREIHDGVSQTLFMLSMSLETGQVLAQKESAEKTGNHLASLIPIARGALTELRNSMYNLTPLAEGEQTLAQALEQLVRDYQSATGLQLKLSSEDDFTEPPAHALGVYRMAQEALANACKHSQASTIEVLLSATGVEITDDGTGFDPGEVSRGRGLGNLERRAEELGIRLDLSSGNEGTRVTIDWREMQ